MVASRIVIMWSRSVRGPASLSLDQPSCDLGQPSCIVLKANLSMYIELIVVRVSEVQECSHGLDRERLAGLLLLHGSDQLTAGGSGFRPEFLSNHRELPLAIFTELLNPSLRAIRRFADAAS